MSTDQDLEEYSLFKYNVPMGIEKLLRRQETPPSLNSCTWEYSERNSRLKPSSFHIKYPDLRTMTSAMRQCVRKVSQIVNDGWQFNCVVTDNRDIAIVYVNPERYLLSPMPPEITEFVKPDFLIEHSADELEDAVSDDLLSGTNYVVGYAFAEYNTVELRRKSKIPFIKAKLVEVYQSGVAYICIEPITVEEAIEIEQGIRRTWEIMEDGHGLLLSSRRILSLQENRDQEAQELF